MFFFFFLLMAAQIEQEDKTTNPRKEGRKGRGDAALSVLIRGERAGQREGCVAHGTLPLAQQKWERWESCLRGSHRNYEHDTRGGAAESRIRPGRIPTRTRQEEEE